MAAAETSETAGDGAQKRRRLRAIITGKSLLKGGNFRLMSGNQSSFYFDMKPTIFDPEGANLIADLILDALRPIAVDAIGGPALGAIPIVACVCQKSFPKRPLAGFFIRKEPKDHGTGRLVEGPARPEDLAGRRAVLVEDVTTTGGSLLRALKAAREVGAIVENAITIVDREQGAGDNLAREGLALISILRASEFSL
jgi:orotate phosphoribosyltransferase